MDRKFLSEEKSFDFFRNNLQSDIEYLDFLKHKTHHLSSFEELEFIKKGSIIIDSQELPSDFYPLKKVINTNPYEVKAFSINIPSAIPICYISYESKTKLDDYMDACRIGSIVLA